MALKGYGVWSLVVQQLVERFIELATLLWVTRWYPSLRFSWSAFSELWTYSSRILFINILNFASSNIDRLLIGQFFGITALGVYVVGRRIVDVIIDVVRVVIGRVALSFFSRLQFDVERLFEGSFVVDRLVTLFGLPVMGLFLVYGGEITTAVFGEKWRDAGIVCQIVAMGGIIRLCILFAQPLLKSTGHPGSLVTANLAMIATSILLSTALASFGLNAFIAGWVSGYIAFACLMFYSLRKLLHYPIARVLRQYVGPFLALMCTWIFTMAIDPITAEYLKNPHGLMLLRSILFIFFYSIFVLLLNFEAVKQSYLDVNVLFHPKKKA
jgi:O-antigen/teichoic acid export membrane protein